MDPYNDYKHESWETADKELVFEFKIAKDLNQTPAVIALVFWRDCPNDAFKVVLEKFFQQVEFFHRYANGGTVRGTIHGVAFDGPARGEELGIWGDIHYGRYDHAHFEGVMATVASHQPPPPAPPYHGGGGGKPVNTLPIHIDEVSDLFPYIYMHPWPNISASDLMEHFIQFNPNDVTPPPQGNFFAELENIKQSGGSQARFQMQSLAVAFINGDPPWTGAFVEKPSQLQGPIAGFADAVRLIRNLEEPTAEKIIEDLEELLESDRGQLEKFLQSTAYRQDLARVWYSFFALMIELGFDEGDLEALILTLVGANILNVLITDRPEPAPGFVLGLSRAHILLPSQVFPLPPGPMFPPLSPPVPTGSIEPYAIGDLQMARQRLAGYRPGEIARVVNVLPGERRNTRSRRLDRVKESLRESHSERTAQDQDFRETQNSLREETLRTLAANILTTQYTDFKTTYGPPTVADLDGKWSVTAEPEAPSKEDVARFAKDILNRAKNQVTRKVDRLRAQASLNEYEETADSLIDNSNRGEPLVGVFRWLNKLYQIYVVNYGTRLIIEFLVDRPAACYLASREAADAPATTPASAPSLPTIQSPAAITPQNYLRLAALYGAKEVTPPPPLHRTVSMTLKEDADTKILLPKGYRALKAFVTFVASTNARVEGIVGRNTFSFSGLSGNQSFTLNGEQEAVAAAALAVDFGSPPQTPDIAVAVEIEAALAPDRLQAWQLEVYRELCRAGDSRPLEPVAKDREQEERETPEIYRAIVGRELKRDAIRLLFQRHEELVGMPLSPPAGQPPQYAINEPRFADFFQHAFEWPEMSFQLYESGPCGGYSNHFDPHLEAYPGVEDRFGAFLRAKAARILVPVRPSFNFAVLYFLSAGAILPLDNALAPVNPMDVSVANTVIEAFAPDQPIPLARPTGESWEMVVPTSLQIMESGLELYTKPQPVEEERD